MKATLQADVSSVQETGTLEIGNQRAQRYDALAAVRSKFRKRNAYYHRQIEQRYRFIIPTGSSVLEIGCATGDLLAALEPSRGIGIDFSPRMIEEARARHRDLPPWIVPSPRVRIWVFRKGSSWQESVIQENRSSATCVKRRF